MSLTPMGVGMEGRKDKVTDRKYHLCYLPMFSSLIFSTLVINSKAISRLSLFWMASRGSALYLRGRERKNVKGGRGENERERQEERRE